MLAIPQRRKLESNVPLVTHIYLVVQMVGVFLIHDDISRLEPQMTWLQVVAVSVFLLWTMASIGIHYDQHYLTGPVEICR